MVQQETDGTDGNADEENLLLRHLALLHWTFVIPEL